LCYNRYRISAIYSTINSIGRSTRLKEIRFVDRPNCGTFYCDDEDGNGHWAYEEIGPGLTVAGAWASLRKCWKGYRIASGCSDDDGKMLYAGRIVSLCHLLKKNPPRFQELEVAEEEENNNDGAGEVGDGYHHYYYYSGGNVDGNCCD
jgi:hypothetical protein